MLALAAKLTALYFSAHTSKSAYKHDLEKFPSNFPGATTSSVAITAMYLLLAQSGAGEFPRSAFLLGTQPPLIFACGLQQPGSAATKPPTEIAILRVQANWKNWLTEGFTYYGVFGGLLALYMLFNKIMFGTSSPVSGQIKRWWGGMPNTVYERPASNWYSFSGSAHEISSPGIPPRPVFMARKCSSPSSAAQTWTMKDITFPCSSSSLRG